MENTGDIIKSSVEGGIIKGVSYTGGITGHNSGEIKESSSNIGVKGEEGVSVGGLVGVNIFGKIIECHAEGDLEGKSSTIGGLVGRSSGGIIKKSYARGNVEGEYRVGGLAGSNVGTIRESYALGNVDGGKSSNVGGMVGYNYNAGNIIENYAQGDVSGGSNIGGLVGYNVNGDIINNYATGNVEGESKVGGFVGTNDDKIKNGYAASRVTGDEYVGGFAGNNEEGTIKYSYYDKDISGKDKENGIAKSREEMMQQATFEPEWDFDYIWGIDEDSNYPYLKWQEENIPYPSK